MAATAGDAMTRTPVVLAASLGGHLELLDALRPAFGERPRHWVTSPGSRADALRAAGEQVSTLPRMDRANPSVANLRAGIGLARALHPRLVVTSGAGVVLPFCLAARALGARIVFVETMARVDDGSLTGRALARVAQRVFVQWPELQRVYPSATVCRPALLEDVGMIGRAGGDGTFVTLGSHDQPFDRLLELVDDAATRGLLPAPVVAQVGASRVDWPALQTVSYLSPDAFADHVAQASVVVAHGGAGAIATVLRSGARPLVLARQAQRLEHVDDHQRQLVRKLDQLGLVVDADGGIDGDLIARTRRAQQAKTAFDGLPRLIDALSDQLGEVAA